MHVLIIRFSSFGDILQTLPAIDALADSGYRVSYFTKKQFALLVDQHPRISGVIELEDKSRLSHLWRASHQIAQMDITHIYDAHNNLRSLILKFMLMLFSFYYKKNYSFLTRSKNRFKRFLFFKWRRPVFKMPFIGAQSFLDPLLKWKVQFTKSTKPHFFFDSQKLNVNALVPSQKFITLAPSAAWTTKRWPEKYWIELVQSFPQKYFVILGGPKDFFCENIHRASPNNTLNLAGKLNLLESCAAIKTSELLISGDTGLLHAADQMNKTCIALIGPTAFGYPFNSQSTVLETHLSCKPCSKDGRDACTNAIFQKCMIDIKPMIVAKKMDELLKVDAQ